ncbi:MAG: trimethylamine methyltransferase family protein [Halobacteria archaeon]
MVKGGQLKILSKDQIYDIHLATLNVLENTGILIHEPEARKLLKEAGAYVDEKRKLVKIPSHLIEESIRKTPKGFTLYARNPRYNVRIEDKRVCFGPMIGRLHILDLETGKKRRTNLEDVAGLTKLASALEYYALPHSGVMMPHIEGVPDQVVHAYAYYTSVKNSEKVVKGTGRGRERALDCIKMASMIAGCEPEDLGKRPNVFTTCNPISPLQHSVEQTEGLIEYAKHRLPVDIAAEVQAGATSPVTLAGSLVIQNAEVLSGVTIAQLVNPGTPLFYGTAGTIMDMRAGIICKGAIEAGLINAATAQLAQFYGIPSRGTAGDTESKVLDIQAGFEKAITLLMAALAGVNYIWYPGTLEYALTVSYESLVIDNEICGMVLRALKGISIDEDALALDVIGKVGPGGHFLGQKHTIEYLMKEHFIPKLSNRQSREEWEKAGAKDLWEVAKEEVRKILKEYEPIPLEKEIDEELQRFLKEVERRELKAS